MNQKAHVKFIGRTPWCLLALAALFLIGCGREIPQSARAANGKPAIAFIGPPEGRPGMRAMVGGARQYLDNGHVYPFRTYRPANESASALEATLTQVLADEPGVLVVWTDRNDVVSNVIRPRSRVPVITLGGADRDPAAVVHVRVGYAEPLERLIREAYDYADQARSCVLVHRGGREGLGRRLYGRFRYAFAAQSRIALLDERDVVDAAGLEPAMAEMLAEYPHTRLIVTLDPRLWVREPNVRPLPATARFMTIEAGPSLWRRLVAGEACALVGPIDGEIGSAGARIATQLLAGRPIGNNEVLVPCEIVTAETLPGFARRYCEAGALELAEVMQRWGIDALRSKPQ